MPNAAAAQVGDALPARTVGPFARMDFARFSIASGDPNRVHLEEDVAAAAGLPSVIGSGGIVGGIASDVVTSWAGLDAIRHVTGKITFPLFPGTTVTVTGTVTGRAEVDGVVELEVTMAAADQGGVQLYEGVYRVVAR